jgi:glycerol-3-phosphate dehydrogenase
MNPQTEIRDLLVIGGGINGIGIAADAAGRGARVTLCEAGDLGGATSSSSSKLIHGGLRYLEYYEFGLVRKALAEREILLAKAPHIAWPLRFILPHAPQQRPRWMLRAGLFLYDHLARRRRIPGSGAVRLDTPPIEHIFRPQFRHGFSYWDCWVDDARLVIMNALDARAHGARILPRTRVTGLAPKQGHWLAQVRDENTGQCSSIAARVVVNAGGPWAGRVLETLPEGLASRAAPGKRLTLVKGSHLVVPRIHGLDDAFILQNPDGRIVFVLPYEQHYSLIGTTDVPFDGDPRDIRASEEEIDYLLESVRRYVTADLRRESVVHTFSGVRPLYDESTGKSASAVSRDYTLQQLPVDGAAPLLSVFGGKITTYRQLSEMVVDQLGQWLPGLGPAWTAGAVLPGGDLGGLEFDAFAAQLEQQRPQLPGDLLRALARRYGGLVDTVLGDAQQLDELGQHFGGQLYEREVRYLIEQEWAQTAQDILWRRTKVGLAMSEAERESFAAAFADLTRGVYA